VPLKNKGGVMVEISSFLTSGLDGDELSTPHRVHFTPGTFSLYPLYRRLVETQGQFGRACRKDSLSLLEFELRIVRPMEGRYTDNATPPSIAITTCTPHEILLRYLRTRQKTFGFHKIRKIYYPKTLGFTGTATVPEFICLISSFSFLVEVTEEN
jgi:hypothetical protein